MVSIVTLAHRASSVHKRYAAIHAAVFSFAISQLKFNFWKRGEPEYCRYERELTQLCDELAEIRSIIETEEELEPLNTVGREFAFALDVYIIALTDAITGLARICSRKCKGKKGLEKYNREQDRAERQEYDDAIQQYRRLGKRLGDLFERL